MKDKMFIACASLDEFCLHSTAASENVALDSAMEEGAYEAGTKVTVYQLVEKDSYIVETKLRRVNN